MSTRKSLVRALALFCTAAAASSAAQAGPQDPAHDRTPLPAPEHETPQHWYDSGQQALQDALSMQANTAPARNVILFIGDGMGVSTVTAARIHDGQQRGQSGEENSLSFESFPHIALSKTYNSNQQTADSAGTMTAMMAGIKTRAGVIGLNQHALRADCDSAQQTEVPNFLQQMAAANRSTGIVTTTRITHATPAATYAHSPERDWEVDSEMPWQALNSGCQDIARQLLDAEYGGRPDVALGGGLLHFLPDHASGPLGGNGNRLDGRDLTQEWQALAPDAEFIWNREQLLALETDRLRPVLGLFSNSHMPYAVDREGADATEPGLPQMTGTAIELLQNNPEGFFLMVEGGRIDHGHHAGNAYRALEDTREFAEAVRVAREMTDEQDTLIIVTADHSHTLTLAGYPTRGNPILGTVVGNDARGQPEHDARLATDNLPYTTLGYRDGRGFADGVGGDLRYRHPPATGRHDLSEIDTTHPDFHQEALVPMAMEGHAGEDVAIYAVGPWAHLFHQTHEQHYIYHVMRHAAQLDAHGSAQGGS